MKPAIRLPNRIKIVMEKRLIITILIVSMSLLCAQTERNIYNISIVRLISNPKLFHQKKVRVEGVLSYKFESIALWISKESLKYNVNKNAIWLNFKLNTCEIFSETRIDTSIPPIPKLMATKMILKKLHNKYVVIEGVFNANQNGHLNLFSGSINEVTKCKPTEKVDINRFIPEKVKKYLKNGK